MIKRTSIVACLLLGLTLQALPQKIITLGQCYEMAEGKSALSAEKGLHSTISAMKDRNLSRNWLPSLDAGATVLYNSEMIDLGDKFAAIPIPGLSDLIKPMPHEQYKVTLDITQTIYDGGAVKAAREVENKSLEVSIKETETDLYKIRTQVNNCFFPVLMLEKQAESLTLYRELIEKRISAMESALRNGVALASDIDIMKAEKLKIVQQLKEVEIKRSAMLKVLSDLTGTEIGPQDKLSPPLPVNDQDYDLARPELRYLDLRKEQISAGMKLASTRRMPKAYGFATLGYGNPPGNNFLKDEFAPYYILGAGIKWNIWDWNRVKTEKNIMALEQNILDKRKTDLEEYLRRLLEAKKAEIVSLEYLLESDREIIELRKRISASAQSKYENGTITVTELLNELNSERQAGVSHELHKISLAQAKTEYLNISGQEVK